MDVPVITPQPVNCAPLARAAPCLDDQDVHGQVRSGWAQGRSGLASGKPLDGHDSEGWDEGDDFQHVEGLAGACRVFDVPGLLAPVEEKGHWARLPWQYASNEERLRAEDAIALSLSDSARCSLGQVVQFLASSLWSRTGDGGLSRKGCTEVRHVFGLFTHGGVVGVTRGTARFPGFARLLVRIAKECCPTLPFSSVAVISEADVPPHRDKDNRSHCNLLVPIKLPSKGLVLWSDLQQGDFVVGQPSSVVTLSGRTLVGQEQVLKLGQAARLDARTWHAARAIGKGETMCVVAYTLSGVSRITSDIQAQLKASGFPLSADVQQGGGGRDFKNFNSELGSGGVGDGGSIGTVAPIRKA